MRVGSATNWLSSLSAGGQDEQPCEVNSSMTARGSAPAYENGAAVHATTIAHAKQSRTITTLPAPRPGLTAKARPGPLTMGQLAPGQPTLVQLAGRLYPPETRT